MRLALIFCAGIALAQTIWEPVGDPRFDAVEHDGHAYVVMIQRLRARCVSQQANDCESRVLRADVTVERVGGGFRSRRHRVCETAACAKEDPLAFVKAAIAEARTKANF